MYGIKVTSDNENRLVLGWPLLLIALLTVAQGHSGGDFLAHDDAKDITSVILLSVSRHLGGQLLLMHGARLRWGGPH